ncbi:N6-adenine-specific methylase [Lacticaseibacillus sharpeae JCM 1186 = DSM 20505]|uniref:N6-adenine-specific methylase n=2 Tax=Lacticaseibacillus sharpeae TaxID=1626 RepID=A0A0R1ZV40_9LACO|nr:N6-adenine-specific methylase [Lacticaseibacillus sharpeae JCM 1186 = DSM 20505]
MVPGTTTRPTADKVKESMFNMLGPYFDGGQAVDFYAGTGGLGIEAVSRGMDHAVLVDSAFAAIKTIKANVELTKAAERFTVKKMSVQRALDEFIAEKKQFDLIMMDPPYAKQQALKQLEQIRAGHLLVPGGRIMIETGLEVAYPETIPGYTLLRKQTYGVAEVIILEAE